MSVVSLLFLPVREGVVPDDVIRAFADARIFELSRQSGGFRDGRLLRPLRAGEPMCVIAEWESARDYQRWLDNPVRASLAESLSPYVAGEIAGGSLYEDG